MADIGVAHAKLLRLEKLALGGAETPSARLLLYFIHRSAWKMNSPKFGCRIMYRTSPEGPENGYSRKFRTAPAPCSRVLAQHYPMISISACTFPDFGAFFCFISSILCSFWEVNLAASDSFNPSLNTRFFPGL